MTVRDPEVVALIEALDSELAESEYTENASFGYSTHEPEAGLVHLVGASVGDRWSASAASSSRTASSPS